MNKLVYAVLMSVLCSVSSAIATPEPPYIVVEPTFNDGLVVSPHDGYSQPLPHSTIFVEIQYPMGNPIPNAAITVEFHSDIAVCDSFVSPVYTDSNGQATIVLAAAGCVHDVPNAVVIKAEGIIIATRRHVKSPANGSASGSAPLSSVGTAALVAFGSAFNGTATDTWCMDLDNDGSVGVGDLVPFAIAFNHSHNCNLSVP